MKNWQNHREWFSKHFWNASKTWESFRSKRIWFRTSWSREMLKGVSLVVNSCFKDRIGRGFYIVFTVPTLCSAFGGTSSVWCIMNCWNRVKRSQRIGIKCNWCVWAEHWRWNAYNTKGDTTKLSLSISTFDPMLQDQSRHTWKRWNGRSYSTRRTL